MPRLRRELALAIGPLAVAAALVATGLAVARFARDAGAANETLYLALWSASILGPLAWTTARSGVRRSGSRWVVAAVSLGVGMTIALLPRSGGARAATVALLLVVALLVAAAHCAGSRARTRGPEWFALALAGAWLAFGHRLWVAPLAPATLALLGALPAAAAVAAWRIGRMHPEAGAVSATALLLAPLIAGESALVLLALLCLTLFALLGRKPFAAAARIAFAGSATVCLLVGAFPWLRPQPFSTFARALLVAPTHGATLNERAITLTAQRPRVELPLNGNLVSSIRFDSFLTYSSAMPCGAPFARVELAGEAASEGELLIGEHSAEWAAERPDVAAALACSPPPAWIRFVPSNGRFLGRISRAELRPEVPARFDRLIVERPAGLPPELTVSLLAVVTESADR